MRTCPRRGSGSGRSRTASSASWQTTALTVAAPRELPPSAHSRTARANALTSPHPPREYCRVSAPRTPIYLTDSEGAPDDEFEAGELRHLVPGNRGRLLDPRRTPVLVAEIHAAQGLFEVEILDFEDRGACWLVPFEEAGRYQFERGSQAAGAALLADYERAVRRFDRELLIAAPRPRATRRSRGSRPRAAPPRAGSMPMASCA